MTLAGSTRSEDGQLAHDPPQSVADDAAPRVRAWRRVLRWQVLRSRWVNAVLALLLVGAVALAYLVIGDPSPAATSAQRTATVTRGTVTASVSGTGNLQSATTSTLNFTTAGTLTALDVAVGDKVTKGELLATIDDSSARLTLDKVKAALESAQASYDETSAGRTSIEAAQDSLAVQSAKLAVTSAKNSLSQADSQLTADKAAGAGSTVIRKDELAVAEAKQQVAEAKNKLAQQETTAAQNAAKPTTAELAQARANLDSAKADVASAQDALDGTRLRAPQAGTVLSISAAVGDTVSSGSSSSNASSSTSSGSSTGGSTSGANGSSSSSSSSGLIVISDLSRLQLTANVAEADIAGVKVGQTAEVTLSATSTRAAAKVTDVSLTGTTSNNVVQYPVTVELDDAPADARLGSSASVTITTGSKSDVLYLPSSAITTLGTRSTVTVSRNGVTSTVPVEAGLVGSSTTEIVSGLSEGQTVMISSTSGTTTSTGIPGLGRAPGTGLGGRP